MKLMFLNLDFDFSKFSADLHDPFTQLTDRPTTQREEFTFVRQFD